MRRQPKISKRQIAEWLKRRFFLRLHMFWILSGTFLAGLATTNLLLRWEVNVLPLRYVLAVCAAYLVFLVLIRLWLWYVGLSVRPDPGLDLDAIEIPVQLLSHLGPVDVPDFSGGGDFGGGGATGVWGDGGADVDVANSSSSSGGNIADGASGSFDVDEGVVFVLFALLVLGLLVAGIYIIWAGPAILAEAAFEAALAATLARSARRIDRPGWVGRVWRATIWPFIGILVLAGVVGFAAQHHCPDAKRLRDALNCVSTDPAGTEDAVSSAAP